MTEMNTTETDMQQARRDYVMAPSAADQYTVPPYSPIDDREPKPMGQYPPPQYGAQPPQYPGFVSPQQNWGQGTYAPNQPQYGAQPPQYPGFVGPQQNWGQSTYAPTQPPCLMASTQVVFQGAPPQPSNFMVLAIIVCLFINFIFGLIAILISIRSSSAYEEGNMDLARSRGKASMWTSVAGIIVSVCFGVAYLIVTSQSY